MFFLPRNDAQNKPISTSPIIRVDICGPFDIFGCLMSWNIVFWWNCTNTKREPVCLHLVVSNIITNRWPKRPTPPRKKSLNVLGDFEVLFCNTSLPNLLWNNFYGFVCKYCTFFLHLRISNIITWAKRGEILSCIVFWKFLGVGVILGPHFKNSFRAGVEYFLRF